MNWPASILVALLTGVLGTVCTGLVAIGAVDWYRIPAREGQSGYFVIFLGLLGGIAGLIIGIVSARIVATTATPGFFKGLGLAWGIVVAIAGSAALVSWSLADIPPKIGGELLDLAVEIRLPIDETNPASVTGDSYLTLGSINPLNHVLRKSEQGTLEVSQAKLVDGRWVIPGSVCLFTTRGKPFIAVQLGGKSRGGFMVPMPARPRRIQEAWSEWLPRSQPDGKPWPDTESSFRFRVQRHVAPSPETQLDTAVTS
jgi:hypothetical protein